MKNTGKKRTEKGEVGRSILLMASIFGLHILLIIGLVLLVIILQGFLKYTLWIFLGGLGLILLSGLLIWKRLKRRKEDVSDVLNSPTFQGREVEVSFLGGTVNLRFGAQDRNKADQQALQGQGPGSGVPELEDKETALTRQLTELSRLMEKGLLTEEEYQRAKKRLLEEGS